MVYTSLIHNSGGVMKQLLIAIGVLIVLGIGIYLITDKKPEDTARAQKLPATTKIYDVRTAEEYAAGHIAGATLMPDYEIAAGKYPTVAKDAPIAVYCRSGNRSAGATENLKKAGFTNITDLGGLSDVRSRGYTLVTN